MSPRVSIIIVNWNGLEHLEVCLGSLQRQTFRDFEVVLVDNGSRDGSVEFVRRRFSWVRLVPLPENRGFAGGNNAGFEHARGDYIVLLNNDTRADAGWLAELVAVADAYPRAGMVGSRTCAFDDPDLIDSLGHKICRDGISRGAHRGKRFSTLGLERVEQTLLPSACAALYKRRMIEEIGFFDEDFFAYCEDTDLGLRGRLAGWDAVVATHAVVEHRYSATAGSFSPFKIHLVERNHYWVAVKNFPPGALVLVPFFTLVRYLLQVKAVLAGRGTGGEFLICGSKTSVARANLRGIIDALSGLKRAFRKRRQIMSAKTLAPCEMKCLLKAHRLSFDELLDNAD